MKMVTGFSLPSVVKNWFWLPPPPHVCWFVGEHTSDAPAALFPGDVVDVLHHHGHHPLRVPEPTVPLRRHGVDADARGAQHGQCPLVSTRFSVPQSAQCEKRISHHATQKQNAKFEMLCVETQVKVLSLLQCEGAS